MLLTMSWRQTPCGAYRDDTRVIAAKIGATEKFVQVHRADLLRGWYLCRDGRLYHPVITEKVLAFIKVRAKWADEKKQQRRSNVRADSTGSPHRVHHRSAPSSSSSSSSSSSEREERATGSRRARATRTRCPEDWEPGEKAQRYISDFGISLAEARHVVTEFRDYWSGRKTARVDWDSVFTKNSKVEASLIRLRDHKNGDGSSRQSNDTPMHASHRHTIDDLDERFLR
jgi:hypothetical protein